MPLRYISHPPEAQIGKGQVAYLPPTDYELYLWPIIIIYTRKTMAIDRIEYFDQPHQTLDHANRYFRSRATSEGWA